MVSMKVISVNVGKPRDVEWKGETISTGIYKSPVSTPVEMKTLNLDGDGQADLTVHGGVNMAVYVYSADHYDYWKSQLPEHDLEWGAFGENLTVAGCVDHETFIGNRFRIGTAEVQVTQPRVPCYKLGIRFGDQGMVKQFMDTGRLGFYLRVLKEGVVQAGDEMELVEQDSGKISVSDIMTLYLNPNERDLMQRAVAVEALADSWRDHFAEILSNGSS